MALTAQRRRPVPHKKRAGQHHKKNQRYLKHYWPYLPMLLIVGVGLLLNSFWAQRSVVLGDRTDLTASQLVYETNQQRHAAHETDLSLDNQLTAAAQAKANDMVARDYWSHTTPTGDAPWSFITSAGYNYRSAGENLAYGFSTTTETINGWMHSPEHRANILGRDYRDVGFATATSSNYLGHGPKTIIVALYASPASTIPALTTSQSTAPTSVETAPLTARPVSRVAALNSTNLLPLVVACLTTVTLVIFISRHARLLHNNLRRGEMFVLHHPLLDISLVALATIGFVLIQANAFVL